MSTQASRTGATAAVEIAGPVDRDRYARITRLIATERCVILDGANGTELIAVGGERPDVEEHLWGLTAILDASSQVKDVHRRYIDVGCDMITTNTWGLADRAS